MIDLDRRQLLTGIGVLICAPAIVRASSLMPVRMPVMPLSYFFDEDGRAKRQFLVDVVRGDLAFPNENVREIAGGMEFAVGDVKRVWHRDMEHKVMGWPGDVRFVAPKKTPAQIQSWTRCHRQRHA